MFGCGRTYSTYLLPIQVYIGITRIYLFILIGIIIVTEVTAIFARLLLNFLSMYHTYNIESICLCTERLRPSTWALAL